MNGDVGKGIDNAVKNAGSITSADLLGTARQLVISHNGENYTLRITANNKLILTK